MSFHSKIPFQENVKNVSNVGSTNHSTNVAKGSQTCEPRTVIASLLVAWATQGAHWDTKTPQRRPRTPRGWFLKAFRSVSNGLVANFSLFDHAISCSRVDHAEDALLIHTHSNASTVSHRLKSGTVAGLPTRQLDIQYTQYWIRSNNFRIH